MYNIPCIEYNTMKPSVKSSTTSVLRKGAWTAEEDMLLKNCIEKFGEGKWHLVPLKAGLNRCRKSCRLRWLNYLRPNIKRGDFGEDEVDLMLRLHKLLGNRWSLIAGRIPGRTANDVKNYWNTHLRSRFKQRKQDGESSQHTTVTIIKPKPRTISRILNDHNPHPEANDDVSLVGSLNDDVTHISPQIISNPGEPNDKINEYLDELFNDDCQRKEINDEVELSFGGFSGEGEALYVIEQGENHNNSLLDLSKDDFLWDLLDLE